jgi:hypothetical protein
LKSFERDWQQSYIKRSGAYVGLWIRSTLAWIPFLLHLPSYLQGLVICEVCVNSSIVDEGAPVYKKNIYKIEGQFIPI